MAAKTPREEIRSFLVRTGGGFGKDRHLTTHFAVVSEAGQWHVLLNTTSAERAQAAIDQWRQRTCGRGAVIVTAAELDA